MYDTLSQAEKAKVGTLWDHICEMIRGDGWNVEENGPAEKALFDACVLAVVESRTLRQPPTGRDPLLAEPSLVHWLPDMQAAAPEPHTECGRAVAGLNPAVETYTGRRHLATCAECQPGLDCY